MVQFNSIFQRNNSLNLSTRYYKYDVIIRQPILSYIFFYNEITKKADELNTALWDKLVEKKTALQTVNFIGREYYNENIKIENDVIILFSLFRISDSYQYINETGYYYIRNHKDSITNSWKNPKISNQVIHGIFVNVKFIFEKTRNTYLDKSLSYFKLQQSFKRYSECFINIKKEYFFIENIIKVMLSSKYFHHNERIVISNINESIALIYNFQKKK